MWQKLGRKLFYASYVVFFLCPVLFFLFTMAPMAFFLSGFFWGERLHDYNELVMCDGMTIAVHGRDGPLTLTGYQGTGRGYALGNIHTRFKLEPNPGRYKGSLGIAGSPPSRHGVVQIDGDMAEGYQYFANEQEATEWLRLNNLPHGWNHTSDGLVVGYYWHEDLNPPYYLRYRLNVSLWQFYINGKKPTHLPGANDQVFQIHYAKGPCRHGPSGFVASQPQVIAGRLYAGRALDAMKEQSLDAEDVEAVIHHGICHGGNIYGYRTCEMPRPPSRPVTLDASGRVVHVGF
jgi:hypothetical protein